MDEPLRHAIVRVSKNDGTRTVVLVTYENVRDFVHDLMEKSRATHLDEDKVPFTYEKATLRSALLITIEDF